MVGPGRVNEWIGEDLLGTGVEECSPAIAWNQIVSHR